jgi:hypothetical protein
VDDPVLLGIASVGAVVWAGGLVSFTLRRERKPHSKLLAVRRETGKE